MGLHTSLALNADPSDQTPDVRRAAAGDARAFERVYRATVPRVYALACRMAGDAVADDLTQEVYLRVWTRLHTFRGDARFETWLHRLAVNLILTRREALRRDESRNVSAPAWLERVAGRVRSPGASMDLEAAVKTLPERARDVFVLHDVEGYKHEEIGEMLGISPGTSKSQLHRARLLLRRHLDS
jgi:RNA polymerase sigma-70 factor (ECF subfamily)